MITEGDRLNILGYIYTVHFVKDSLVNSGNYGLCNYRKQVIEIDYDIAQKFPDQLLDTLLHEIQHIINRDPSSKRTEEDEELFTASISHQWSTVLIDNPELVRTISELTQKIVKGTIKW